MSICVAYLLHSVAYLASIYLLSRFSVASAVIYGFISEIEGRISHRLLALA